MDMGAGSQSANALTHALTQALAEARTQALAQAHTQAKVYSYHRFTAEDIAQSLDTLLEFRRIGRILSGRNFLI